ncbi:MAG TPA: HGxxPAAW family protein [Streptosporangiaceae bacterium]|nr:HGxxPAAW family protein [Streptosporangiaceae bacterium]
MADQSGTMAQTAGTTGSHALDVQSGLSHIHEENHGRPVSWVAVTIIVVGFIIGGIAMVTGPTWWLFWAGAGIVVIGSIFAAAVRVFDDWY